MAEPRTIVLALQLSDLRDWAATHGSRVVVILIAAAVARVLIHRIVPPAVRGALTISAEQEDPLELRKRADTLSHVLVRLADAAIVILAVFMLLGEVGYNVAPVVAGLGIGGVAIGLGAQSLVKDTINGIFILGENQFRRGDFVTVAGVSGTVIDVNLRRTLLRDLDGTVHSVPNSAIQVASNHTRDYSGVNLTVLISHNSDLEQAISLATQVGTELQQDPALSADIIEPPRPARIETVDQNGVTLRILGKARAGAAAGITFEYRRRLSHRFDVAGLRFTVAGPPAATIAGPPKARPSSGSEPHGQ